MATDVSSIKLVVVGGIFIIVSVGLTFSHCSLSLPRWCCWENMHAHFIYLEQIS